jgi:hypothetical protein
MNNINDKKTGSTVGLKGMYQRPSKAIEKGGGFFIPGLENEKLRLVAISGLMIMFAINRSGSSSESFPLILSEIIGITMAIYIYIQSTFSSSNDENNNSGISYLTVKNMNTIDKMNILQNTVRSIIRTCIGIYDIIIIKDDKILIEIGPVGIDNSDKILQDLKKIEINNIDDFLIKDMSNSINKELFKNSNTSTDIKYIILYKDLLNKLWIFRINDIQEFKNNKDWIKALINTPILTNN